MLRGILCVSSFEIRCVVRPQPAIQTLGSVDDTPVQALRVKNGCRQPALSSRLHYTVTNLSSRVPHLMSSPNLNLPVSTFPAPGDVWRSRSPSPPQTPCLEPRSCECFLVFPFLLVIIAHMLLQVSGGPVLPSPAMLSHIPP